MHECDENVTNVYIVRRYYVVYNLKIRMVHLQRSNFQREQCQFER